MTHAFGDLLDRNHLMAALQERGVGEKTFRRLLPSLPRVEVPGRAKPLFRLADVLEFLGSLPSRRPQPARPLHRGRGMNNRLGLIA